MIYILMDQNHLVYFYLHSKLIVIFLLNVSVEILMLLPATNDNVSSGLVANINDELELTVEKELVVAPLEM